MFLKHYLFKLLGPKNYLGFISKGFFAMYNLGFLKGKPEFYNHYFIQNLINKGDTIIDIGANLGYYTVLFSKLCGSKGHVYAIEPVDLYRSILKSNIGGLKNVSILPFALGKENGKKIAMGIPLSTSNFRHGLTRVLNESEKNTYTHTFTAEMRQPVDLFNNLERLDYIKCDVEGYEIVVIPEMIPLIEKFKPIIQLETGGNTRKELTELLNQKGYKDFFVDNNNLVPLISAEQAFTGDVIFMTQEHINKYKHYINL
jgi:FkbM family methyltransferase